jgi:hypothetical protein
METLEFLEFPKMPRLFREIIITEKIDGTNAQILIQDASTGLDLDDPSILMEVGFNNHILTLRAGSRTRWITAENDNYGFAKWVTDNAVELFSLGEGRHFGEWWGSGIQRGYGLPKGEKRFSLFNTYRWSDDKVRPKCCHVVPVLYQGKFDTNIIEVVTDKLKDEGSIAAPGFMKPEGIIMWHTAGNFGFKRTIEKDDVPKSLVKN